MQSRVLSVLEAAALAHEPEAAWAARVAVRLGEAVHGGLRGIVLAYDRVAGRLEFLAAPEPAVRRVMLAGQTSLDAPRLEQVYGQASAHTSTEVLGPVLPPPLREALADTGAADVLGVAGPADGRGRGLSLGVLLDAARPLSGMERRLLRALGAQLGAARRLRGALERLAAGEDAPDPLADGLAGALRELDRRRARAVRSPGDPSAADVLHLQERLLARGYAVVPVEAGGRTRLVAVRAVDEPAPSLRSLSPGERDVVRHAAAGLSDKEIAWELQLPEGTVASRLRRARQRLGVVSRVDLVRLLGGLP